ncbi:MAG: hypothetical protein HY319_11400 [Armatimonadetes bacterium]|nr:hypothetical protein [Armatimonadota bacterium]
MALLRFPVPFQPDSDDRQGRPRRDRRGTSTPVGITVGAALALASIWKIFSNAG